MTEPMQILIVEDLPTDAELAEREIQKVLGPCLFRRVETRAEYIAALEELRPALIVSDFKLPTFDGLTALQLAMEHCPDVPFIIVTGSMNEDTAVDCMKAGAWDYVIKEHIKRLGPAVQSALERQRVRAAQKRAEAERDQLEQQLRTSQKMEAIGSLAGGIAHDFNNLLTVILSYTGLALDDVHEGEPLREGLLEVKKAAGRATSSSASPV